MVCEVETNIVAVERLTEYTDQLNLMVKICFERHDDSKLKSSPSTSRQDQNHINKLPVVFCGAQIKHLLDSSKKYFFLNFSSYQLALKWDEAIFDS